MPSRFTQRVCETTPAFDFVGAHFACEQDRFSTDNPRGFVNLGSAQNFLNPAEVAQRLATIDNAAVDAHYQPFAGTSECQTAIAEYLGETAGTNIAPQDIVVGNGVVHLLEALAIALLDEGDAVLVPTPVFPGLVNALSLRVRSQVALMPLEAEHDFQLTPAAVEEAIAREVANGRYIKSLLLCSPGNPVGQVFDAEVLQQFVDLAERHDLTLIVDEIYAASCFEGADFHSVLALESDRVFVLGGLSKDFGLAGFATGWLHGRDARVMRAVAKQSHFFRLPAPIQRVITSFLDPEWRKPFIATNRRRLTEAVETVRDDLESIGVPVSPSEAGLCLWVDLRAFLVPNADGEIDSAEELRLYRFLLEEHRVHISPGAGFFYPYAGWFRLCFSQDDRTLREGLQRMRHGLHAFAPLLTAV